MSEAPPFPSPFRLAAIALTFGGAGLVAAAGARGPVSLAGFAMFCLGMAGLDGLYRGRFGFRQVALLLGWLAVGMGLWSVFATALLRLLDLPVAGELRTMFVASAVCAAGSATAALLYVRSPRWIREIRVWARIGSFAQGVWGAASRLGGLRHDPRFGAGRPWRPAGPARGG